MKTFLWVVGGIIVLWVLLWSFNTPEKSKIVPVEQQTVTPSNRDTTIPTTVPVVPQTYTPTYTQPTAQCVDGSYSYSQHRQGTCSYHGGVAVWY